MRKNILLDKCRGNQAVVNGWLSIPSSFSAEAMAHQGWDSLTVDLQHGISEYQSAVTMFQAISTTNTVPLARVPWLEEGIIMRMLDAGAYGIICPMVNKAADAERFVQACYYPPTGQRSFGPIRALLYSGPDYPGQANDHILPIAMIETKEALENLEEILKVEGLRMVYIGPSDLSNSLGCTPTFDQEEKPVVEAIDFILAKALEHKVIPGIHNGTPEYALRMIEKGFRFVTVSSDARLMAAGAQNVILEMKSGTGEKSKEEAIRSGSY